MDSSEDESKETFVCKICGDDLKKKSALSRHVRSTHKGYVSQVAQEDQSAKSRPQNLQPAASPPALSSSAAIESSAPDLAGDAAVDPEEPVVVDAQLTEEEIPRGKPSRKKPIEAIVLNPPVPVESLHDIAEDQWSVDPPQSFVPVPHQLVVFQGTSEAWRHFKVVRPYPGFAACNHCNSILRFIFS